MRIHLSPSAKEALSKFAGYHLVDRGLVTVKVCQQGRLDFTSSYVAKDPGIVTEIIVIIIRTCYDVL